MSRSPWRRAGLVAALALVGWGLAAFAARAQSTSPAGGPVPARTRATSVSFISPDTGFVLGTAPCAHAPCSVILRTRDRGASWVGLAAPRQSVSAPDGTGLWGLRFADADDGFAYGDGLWETTDGGGAWHRAVGAAAPGREIAALEPVDARELVSIAIDCRAGGACDALPVLAHRSLAGGHWTVVAHAGHGSVGGDAIAVHGATVWVVLGDRLYASTDGGVAFGSEPAPCSAARPSGLDPVSITDDGAHTYLLCLGEPGAGSAPKLVYATARPGAAWSEVGRPSPAGTGGMIAAGSDRSVLVASSSGASFLDRSTDGGRRWGTALLQDDGGLGWADLGFTTARDAVVVHGPAGDASAGGQVLLSQDGGRHWRDSRF